MTDTRQVMSWLEGLCDDEWPLYHSHSEVQNIAEAALELLEEQESEVEICDRCGRMRLKSCKQK